MKTQDKIRNRLRALRRAGNKLTCNDEYDGLLGSAYDRDECQAWLIAVRSILHSIFGDMSHPYRSHIEQICKGDIRSNTVQRVWQITPILRHLISDFDSGLIFSVESRIRATVFEDFLEQARRYVKSGHVREAGVFAAAVFEDTLRSISRQCGVEEEDLATDKLISELNKRGVFSDVKAKRARTSAGVRNRALHARWDDIDLGDVQTLIAFTEELVSRLDEI